MSKFSWRGLLRAPDFRFRKYFYVLSGFFISIGLLIFLLFLKVSSVLEVVLESTDLSSNVRTDFQDAFLQLAIFSAFCYVVGGLILFYYATSLSSRFFGPLNNITNTVKAFQEGTFGPRRNVRQTDELRELSTEINKLGEILENQKVIIRKEG